jgi:hypothetical protein
MKQKMKHRGTHNPRPPVVGVRPEELEKRLYGAPLTDSSRPKEDHPLSAGAIEARRIIAEAQHKYEQQKENAMKEAIAQNTRVQAALSEWGDDEDSVSKHSQPQAEPANKRHYFKATVGVSQASFNYVRDNPYTTAAQAVKALEQQGFKKTSLTALYTQMIRQGHLSRDKDGKLTALIPEFRPLKATATLRNLGTLLRKKLANAKAIDKADYAPRPVQTIKQIAVRAGIATLNASPAQTALTQPLAQQAQPLTAKQVLETLSIKEAHMLYRELQTMFGG